MQPVCDLRVKLILKAGRCLAAGVIGISFNAGSIADTLPKDQVDSRSLKLQAFFKSYQCPQPYYIDEYLRAADAYAIDYRLLPALSVRESTCGQHHRQNNHWGWDSARSGFASVASGIEFVASRLANGRYYKDKTLEGKLYVYNPYPQYVEQVKRLMREIDN